MGIARVAPATLASLLLLSLLGSASPAGAIVFAGGPDINPPGAGVENSAGDATLVGGATLTYTGIDLSQTDELYYGVRNDNFVNGLALDGVGIAGVEVFTFSSTGANSVTYTGTATFVTDGLNPGVFATPTRITYTFNGTGALVQDPAITALNGANGDVEVLWQVQSDFSVDIVVEAQAPPFDPNAGNWEPANELFNRVETPIVNQSNTSFDWAFYWGTAPTPPIVVDVGPISNPPGAGVESLAGDAALVGGSTLTYTGIDLGQTANLYFGVRNDNFANGGSMDGAGIAGAEVFAYGSHTPTSVTYVGDTFFEVDFPNAGSYATPTRITYTFTGPGQLIEDTTTVGFNGANGDVQVLWHVQGDFSVDVLVEAQAPPFDANAGNWEPLNDLFNRIDSVALVQSANSYDWAFYYEALSLPAVPTLGSRGLAGLVLALAVVAAAMTRRRR